ncbi:MAG: hypothetical protein ACHQT7_00440 [Candidatus Levyibacteriota bacterium]
MASNTLTNAIIKTLCYAQIFSYPLTEAELWRYLLHNKKVSKKRFTAHLSQNLQVFERRDDYVVLRGDAKLIEERIKRHAISTKKLKKAILVSRILFYIPTVQLIGVSGSLSMYNAKREDDIDLFFITSKNFLWTTRFLVNALLWLLGQKRMRAETYAQDKICPNMFMPEDHLHIKKPNQNMYTAHEVVQMKVLFAKEHIYQKFLSQNTWVIRHMPNAFVVPDSAIKQKKHSLHFLASFLSPIEKLLYSAQYFYMKKRITNEKVTKTIASFHPSYHKEAILALYDLKILHNLYQPARIQKTKTAANFKQIN